MQETIGWILTVIGAGCAINAFEISRQHRRPVEFDDRSALQYQFDHIRTLSKMPKFLLNIILGIGLLIIGLCLNGTIGI